MNMYNILLLRFGGKEREEGIGVMSKGRKEGNIFSYICTLPMQKEVLLLHSSELGQGRVYIDILILICRI